MASSPSSFPATTFPTASTKKMRVRSKSTSAVDDINEVPPKNEKKVVEAVHASLKNGINGAQNGEEALFVKAAKDKHHDRKSRSGRRGLPKKGEQVLAISVAKFSDISFFGIPCFVRLAFWRAVALKLDLDFGSLNELWFRIKTSLDSWILHMVRLIWSPATRPTWAVNLLWLEKLHVLFFH